MIFRSSDFFDVEASSDFTSNRFFGCFKHEDPCNPRVRMFIDDNIAPRVLSDVRVIKRIIHKKVDCKKRDCKHHDDDDCGDVSPDIQLHVHEVQGSVEIAGRIPHSHRFATVSGEARFLGSGDHVHDVWFRTDFFQGHYHEAWGTTGGAIWVGDRHVHFLQGVTTVDAGHLHNYRVATMIEDPIGD